MAAIGAPKEPHRFAAKLRRVRDAVVAAGRGGGTESQMPAALEDLMPDWAGERRRKGVEPLTGAMVAQVPEEAVLGRGAYGVVWRAKHRNTQEIFAVKNILPSDSSRKQLLAARELAVAKRVLAAPHPCLVRFVAVGEFADNGLMSFVMEYCPGGDMLGVIDARHKAAKRSRGHYVAPKLAHAWIGQVFLGIEHLHRMDLLSRDVKPGNIVFSSDGVAKLTDFGFGRLSAESDMSKWSFCIPPGTPGYCAPEILRQQVHDHRADLYSLGVVAWMLLTGGLTGSSGAAPPTGGQLARNFKAFVNDWRFLTACITVPEENHARPLPDVARDFVLGLVTSEPAARFGHADIRGHDFMSSLELPPPDAETSEVQAWLKRPLKFVAGSALA